MGHDIRVSDAASTWSPADNPYAIAVSEAQWWFRSAVLANHRIHDSDDLRAGFSSRQMDARQLVVALWQLLVAEKLQQVALRALGMDKTVYAELSRARTRFEQALPGIKHMRDALMHFDEWARGDGSGPQAKEVKAGKLPRDVASMYWGFGYDPQDDTITLGPYVFEIESAIRAAKDLTDAIYLAARAVDARNVTALHARTVEALGAAGLPDGSAGDTLLVSPGPDMYVWLSLSTTAAGHDLEALTEQVISALAVADLRLVSSVEPQSSNPAERLLKGEALYVRPADAAH